MATQLEVRSSIIKRFLSIWRNSNGNYEENGVRYFSQFDLQNDNSKFTPPTDKGFVRPNIQFFESVSPGIGRRVERNGQLVIQLFTTYSEGIKRGDELAQVLLEGFEKTNIDSVGVEFRLGHQVNHGDEGHFWQTNVNIPFIWRDRI